MGTADVWMHDHPVIHARPGFSCFHPSHLSFPFLASWVFIHRILVSIYQIFKCLPLNHCSSRFRQAHHAGAGVSTSSTNMQGETPERVAQLAGHEVIIALFKDAAKLTSSERQPPSPPAALSPAALSHNSLSPAALPPNASLPNASLPNARPPTAAASEDASPSATHCAVPSAASSTASSKVPGASPLPRQPPQHLPQPECFDTATSDKATGDPATGLPETLSGRESTALGAGGHTVASHAGLSASDDTDVQADDERGAANVVTIVSTAPAADLGGAQGDSPASSAGDRHTNPESASTPPQARAADPTAERAAASGGEASAASTGSASEPAAASRQAPRKGSAGATNAQPAREAAGTNQQIAGTAGTAASGQSRSAWRADPTQTLAARWKQNNATANNATATSAPQQQQQQRQKQQQPTALQGTPGAGSAQAQSSTVPPRTPPHLSTKSPLNNDAGEQQQQQAPVSRTTGRYTVSARRRSSQGGSVRSQSPGASGSGADRQLSDPGSASGVGESASTATAWLSEVRYPVVLELSHWNCPIGTLCMQFAVCPLRTGLDMNQGIIL